MTVAVVGEALVDLIEQPSSVGTFLARPGGSPANVAVTLAQHGVPARLVARVSRDRFGAIVRRNLVRAGVDVRHLVETDDPSTLAVASLDERGAASYDFYVNGCADGGWTAQDVDNVDADVFVASGSLALPVPAMGEVVEALLRRVQARGITVFDPNIRPALIAGDRAVVMERLDRWIRSANVVKASREDIEWAYPDETPESVTLHWIDRGVDLAIVTDGKRGAFGRTATVSTWVDAVEVDVVDTVGAGDAFTAGIVKWLVAEGVSPSGITAGQLHDVLCAGVQLASEACVVAGAGWG
jgi:fructokinase